MKKKSNILWGLVFIAIGIIIGLNSLEITNINLFFDGWWTLFIIIPCFIDLFKDKNKTGNIIGVIIGILLLLSCQDFIDFDLIWKLMIPIIFVIIGASLIFKESFYKKTESLKKISSKSDFQMKEYCSTFSSQTVNYDHEEFKGCELTSVFGNIKCDLRNANISKDVIINTTSIFGTIDILFPDNVNVKVEQTAIFGGVSNKTKFKEDTKYTIYINATCLFGGTDLK